MNKNQRLHYYVEGECEEKLVNVLKQERLVRPGKVEVFNVIQNCLTELHARTLSPNTIVVFVFDTDIKATDKLLKNISFLQSHPNIHSILCITQVNNLEDEILRCTTVHKLNDLVKCKTRSEFKSAFIKEKNLWSKLNIYQFDLAILWSRNPTRHFTAHGIKNQAAEIKISSTDSSL